MIYLLLFATLNIVMPDSYFEFETEDTIIRYKVAYLRASEDDVCWSLIWNEYLRDYTHWGDTDYKIIDTVIVPRLNFVHKGRKFKIMMQLKESK